MQRTCENAARHGAAFATPVGLTGAQAGAQVDGTNPGHLPYSSP
jgi:hypothetical protein